ncbi:PEGA domain-containing protein [Thermococcus sp. 18S1]|uniref:PEGA domain-containing protein n=1 Tax=Thermococcus sp. 18S1 TaxID=1638210 RepID=UPI00143C07D1|nr:PEGA domain-containing protein [Thermococcus sp. 18S1]NJE29443.1 PEGA domain-containing protein [Thermococcus sp. 18S1]
MKKTALFFLVLFINCLLTGILVYGASIEIVTYPKNASVYIDGDYKGTTPLNVTISQIMITKRVINVTIKKEGYLPYTTSMFIPSTLYFIELNLTLAPLNGTIIINSDPIGAIVQINGEYKGKTPLSLTLPPGEYNITLSSEGYYPNSAVIGLPPNETKNLSVKLIQRMGLLIINSSPTNAFVIINGTQQECRTPCNITLKPGVYTINVTDGNAQNNTMITLKPDETVSVTLTLQEEPSTTLIPILGMLLIVGAGAGAYIYRSSRPNKKMEGKIKTRKTNSSIEMNAGKAFGISHIGARNNNEDNLLILKLFDAYLLAVADGLGGHNAGEVASQMAVDTLKEVFGQEYRKGMNDKEVKGLLGKAHELAHKRIKENAVGEREGMGTTLVTAFVRDGKAIIANTGDSRAYLIRNGRIIARTKDHSLVQEMLDKGEITPAEAMRHPMRNIITKALGVDFGVDFYEWEIEGGDILLLSSDGLHDYVDEEKIVEIVSRDGSTEEIIRWLIEEALPVTRDNVTVVVWK